ncbi:MAG: hypothetical protein JSR33_13775 [Proteobacteria bacterium]|nr:hypothetical protein [Pseudomonadota bacterium]
MKKKVVRKDCIRNLIYKAIDFHYPYQSNELKSICQNVIQAKIYLDKNLFSTYSTLPANVKNLIYKNIGNKSLECFLSEVIEIKEIDDSMLEEIIMPIVRRDFSVEYKVLMEQSEAKDHPIKTKAHLKTLLIHEHPSYPVMENIAAHLFESIEYLKYFSKQIIFYPPKPPQQLRKDRSFFLTPIRYKKCHITEIIYSRYLILIDLLLYLHNGIDSRKWVAACGFFQGIRREIGLHRIASYLKEICNSKDFSLSTLRKAAERLRDSGNSVGSFLTDSLGVSETLDYGYIEKEDFSSALFCGQSRLA